MSRSRARLGLVSTVAAALLTFGADGTGAARDATTRRAAAAAGDAPAFDASGALLRPEGYRQWVFVGASLGLSYSEGTPDPATEAFHHVYLRPESYAAFRRTGRFPDRTVLMMELHDASEKVAPSRHGRFEGKRIAVEAAVKDSRLADGWGYFSFGDGTNATAKPFPRSACFDCHREHAAADNVFLQFYPVLRDGGH